MVNPYLRTRPGTGGAIALGDPPAVWATQVVFYPPSEDQRCRAWSFFPGSSAATRFRAGVCCTSPKKGSIAKAAASIKTDGRLHTPTRTQRLIKCRYRLIPYLPAQYRVLPIRACS